MAENRQPVCFRGMDVTLRQVEFTCFHHHSFHELFLTTHGSCIQHVPEFSVEGGVGDIFLFPAGVPHLATIPESVDRCDCKVLYFDDNVVDSRVYADAEAGLIMEQLLKVAAKNNWRIPAGKEHLVVITQLLTQINSFSYTSKANRHCRLKALFLNLLATFADIVEDINLKDIAVEQDKVSPAIRCVLDYIDIYYYEDITVADACKMAMMSKSSFHAAFKRDSGQTFVSYLNTCRVNKARKMLMSKPAPDIYSVATRCGFNNLSHFYHTFTRITGMPPGECKITIDG